MATRDIVSPADSGDQRRPGSTGSPLARVVADRALRGDDLRAALVEVADGWLQELFAAASPGGTGGRVALAAVGSLGRRELTPASDLDLVLLHDGGDQAGAGRVAERIWYPVWDSGVGLDHSLRTPAEAAAVAREDLTAMLGLLDLRHLAGDAELTAGLRELHLRHWRADAGRRLPELAATCRDRAARVGELAFLLEPDLKNARGGLRDAQALEQVAAAQRADRPTPALRAAKALLLDVRGELHRPAADGARRGRTTDRLPLQEQDRVAAALGYRDADALMAAVAGAGRGIAYALDVLWRRVLPAGPGSAGAGKGLRDRLLRRTPARAPLAEGVVEQNGEAVLAQAADPARDPLLTLRLAAAAAGAGLPVSPVALERLAALAPPLPEPWPAAALESFVGILATGPAAVPVLEALDQAGLLTRLLPEWEHTRSHPQRNAYHRFTVDRHLLEAAAGAAALTRRVARPDLLLLGALLHDIGKGLPGDHSEVGVGLVGRIGPRLGLDAAETATLATLVRHHLLLADTAQRHDLDDPATIAMVAGVVGDRDTLELLAALTEADSLATGPAAWSPWKARLLADLVRRVSDRLAGHPTVPAAPDERQAALLAAGGTTLAVAGDEYDVVAPDRPHLLAVVAGLLAVHRLQIRTLTTFVDGGRALVVAVAHPRFGTGPDPDVVRGELSRALADPAALGARVAERAAAYPAPRPAAPPTVRWVLDGVTDALLEVRAADGLGVLHRIADALAAEQADVRSARAHTLGADAVDTFTIAGLDAAGRDRVGAAVLAALAPVAAVGP